MQVRLVASLLIALAGAGCASAPTTAQLANAHYGDRPTQPEVVFRDWARDHLFDPASVQDLRIACEKGYWKPGASDGGGPPVFGWMMAATFNAKNRTGGYVGRQTVHLLVRDNYVVKAWDEHAWALRAQYPWMD